MFFEFIWWSITFVLFHPATVCDRFPRWMVRSISNNQPWIPGRCLVFGYNWSVQLPYKAAIIFIIQMDLHSQLDSYHSKCLWTQSYFWNWNNFHVFWCPFQKNSCSIIWWWFAFLCDFYVKCSSDSIIHSNHFISLCIPFFFFFLFIFMKALPSTPRRRCHLLMHTSSCLKCRSVGRRLKYTNYEHN